MKTTYRRITAGTLTALALSLPLAAAPTAGAQTVGGINPGSVESAAFASSKLADPGYMFDSLVSGSAILIQCTILTPGQGSCII